MFPHSAVRLVFLIATPALFTETAFAQEPVALRLHRPVVMGERYSVVSTGQMTRHVRLSEAAGGGRQDDKMEVEYEGEHQVLETAANGNPVKMAVTVTRLITDDGSGKQSQFPAGTRILVEARDGGNKFLLDGTELEGTLDEALALAGAGVPAPGELTDDEVFPSEGPRKPGDSWSANADALRATLEKGLSMRVSRRGTTGKITFTAEDSPAGVHCAKLTLDLDIRPLSLPGLPVGSRITKGSVTGTTLMTLPLDPALPPVEMSYRMKALVSATAGPGEDTPAIEIDTDRSNTVTIRKL